MELPGLRLTDATVKAQHPGLTAEERQQILRYDQLSPTLFATLLSSTSLDPHEQQRLTEIYKRELSLPLRKPTSDTAASLLEKRMCDLGLNTSSVLALFSVNRSLDRREGLSHLRRGMKGSDETSTVLPFGIIAWVLTQSRAELKKILSLRREEIRSSYRKRVGTDLSDASTERKLWGLTDAEIKGVGGDVRKAALKKLTLLGVPAKQKLLGHSVAAPQPFVARALAQAPHNVLAHTAETSASTLHRIASGEIHPTRSLFHRIVVASRVPFVPSLDLLWYDSYAARYKAPGTKSDYGSIQCRILDTLIASRGENQHTLLLQHCTPPIAQRAERALVKLRRSLDIPLIVFHELLGSFGIERDSAHWHAITSMLTAKNTVDAIEYWFRNGMTAADEPLRAAALLLFKGPLVSIRNLITELPKDPHDLMLLSEQLPNHSHPETRRGAAISASLSLLRLFPGATIDDLETARAKLTSNQKLDAAVKFAWSRSGKLPTKDGSLYIEPTSASGGRISRTTAALLTSSSPCPPELSKLLTGNTFPLLNKLDHEPAPDPWSGALLGDERGIPAEELRRISETLLPMLLPALSLKEGVADNLLKWLRALWSNGESAEVVVDAIRRHQATLQPSGKQLPSTTDTPMGIIDAALIAASMYRKKGRR